ncbi:MAG TPA: hypothetical protein VGJ36_01055 [Gemmatimonadales bacterium]|jgi:hypothetical protein
MGQRNFVAADAVQQAADSEQRERPQRNRYQPTAAYSLAERLKSEGVELYSAEGPWRAAGRTLRRPARRSLGLIPLVTNGHTEVMVDTMEHAADVSGLLNWSGVNDLNPVPDLTPPAEIH